jgi:uncharacterized protein (TIRG00374 family)
MAASIEAAEQRGLTWSTIVKRVVVVVLGGVAIYLVLPSITEVIASWPRLRTLDPIWFVAAVVAELAHFVCTFALQRLAVRTKGWFVVVTAQLSGNAVTNVIPAGAPAGAALQFRMMSTAGIPTDAAIGGLTAFTLLTIGGLLALPIFTLPAILLGAPVSRGIFEALLLGVGAFVLFSGFGAVVLSTDAPLLWAGRLAQRIRNRVYRHRAPITGLEDRLLTERNAIRSLLGRSWLRAVLLTSGRLLFDYLCLLAAVRATGSHPRPSLVLLAYGLSGLIALVPITPGGLGIVEASLSGFLILAGVGSSDAFLATLAYRLASYWLPLLAGPAAYALFWSRYGRPRETVATS